MDAVSVQDQSWNATLVSAWPQPRQPSQKELCPLSATYFLVTNVGMGRKAQECLKFQKSACQI